MYSWPVATADLGFREGDGMVNDSDGDGSGRDGGWSSLAVMLFVRDLFSYLLAMALAKESISST